MVNRLGILALLFASVVSLSIRAETIEHKDAGLQFDIPEGWKTEQAEDLLIANNEAGDLVVVIFVAKADNAKEFIDGMGAELGKLISDAEVTSGPKEETINELTQEYVEGTGKYADTDKFIPKGEAKDTEIDWHMTVVVGGKKILVAIAFGKLADDGEKVAALYNSIKKAK